MNDIGDEFYEQADDDFRSNRNNALWIKCLTLARGDETKARYEYIETMARRLSAQTVSLTEQDLALSEPSPPKDPQPQPTVHEAANMVAKKPRSLEKNSEEYHRLFRKFNYNNGRKYDGIHDDEYQYDFHRWLKKNSINLYNPDIVRKYSTTSKSDDDNGNSLIGELFKGNIGLFHTFWVLLIGSRFIFFAFNIVIKLWLPYMTPERRLKLVEMTPTLATIEASVYLFAAVSTWRSANKYDGPVYWKISTKVFIVLLLLWFLLSTVGWIGNYLYYTGKI